MKSLYLSLFLSFLIIFISCKKEQPQSEYDETVIKNYLTLNSIPATRTPSGLYYIITDTTKNTLPTYGKKLVVRYEGRVLSGSFLGPIFDSYYSSSSPFIFTLGSGEVIAGWDEGFMHVRKGESAYFFIPSGLGYGKQGAGTAIPPNSVLHFKVTLEDIQ